MSIRYLALGDSYTVGEGVATRDCWPFALVRQLRHRGVVIDDPRIVAVTGWSTDELAAGIDAAVLTPPYELVSLQIGVNNQYRGHPPDEYRSQFAALLARAIGLAGARAGRVVVLSIPDWGVTRFAREQARDAVRIAHELDVFNAIARDEAACAGTRFVDITAISRRQPQRVVDDGLHPSAAHYALWVAAIAPVMQAALRSAH